MRIPIFIAIALSATGAFADGFVQRDLSGLKAEAEAAFGGRFISRAAPERLTLACLECGDGQMIDVLISRQTDGTEERFRSGETTISRLDSLCRDKNPSCRATTLSVAPAVGWITTYSLGSTAGSTAVILRDGDMLTIRSLAASTEKARENAEILVKTIARRIIGP